MNVSLIIGVVLVGLVCTTFAQFWGVEGDYCKTRKPESCCSDRNDGCSVEISGTLCYCDMFCNLTTSYDCCPDFWPICLGRPHPQLIVIDKCFHEGKSYQKGHTIQVNCNKCTCKQKTATVYEFVCEQNICLVRPELIQKVNNGSYGWKASNYSFFWGKTLEDGIRYRLGTFKPTSLTMAMNEINIMKHELPENFDARQHWPGLIHEVRDQGDCGASWAISTTDLASDRLAIQSMGREKISLSPQQLVSCQNRAQKGCHGGHLDRAWWYLKKRGVVSEECYPYKSGFTKDEGMCSVRKVRGRHGHIGCPNGREESVRQSTPPYRVGPREEEIMQEIYNNGPVQATFKVREDFFLYNSGVYRHTKISEHFPEAYRQHGWHSIRIIGWGLDRSGGSPIKYWLCANSWGQRWGEDGYFRILRGNDECEIEMFIVGVWAKRNMNHESNMDHESNIIKT